jgi:ATP-dependent exoDNAse (exonuclease V) alpha subunit
LPWIERQIGIELAPSQNAAVRLGLDPIRDIQVLCPMNRGGVGARSLNIELQAALNRPETPDGGQCTRQQSSVFRRRNLLGNSAIFS